MNIKRRIQRLFGVGPRFIQAEPGTNPIDEPDLFHRRRARQGRNLFWWGLLALLLVSGAIWAWGAYNASRAGQPLPPPVEAAPVQAAVTVEPSPTNALVAILTPSNTPTPTNTAKPSLLDMFGIGANQPTKPFSPPTVITVEVTRIVTRLAPVNIPVDRIVTVQVTQVVQVQVTRVVEVVREATRLVEVTRVVIITATPAPTWTPWVVTATATYTPSPTPTLTPTATETETATATATETETASPTPTETETETPTATPTAAPTETPNG